MKDTRSVFSTRLFMYSPTPCKLQYVWLSIVKLLVQEYSEILLRCIKENLGFKDGKPVAASVIYKLLLRWHAFEYERTAIFDFIIENINNALKVICSLSASLFVDLQNHHLFLFKIKVPKSPSVSYALFCRRVMDMLHYHTGYPMLQLFYVCCKEISGPMVSWHLCLSIPEHPLSPMRRLHK